MAVKQYRADVSKSLLAISPEQAPSSSDSFSTSGQYIPDMLLLDAKNAMPTATGYTSYFGTKIDFDAPLEKNVQDIITYRTNTGDTVLIALCQDGLYIKSIAGNAVPTIDITTPGEPHVTSRQTITFTESKCEWTLVAFSELGSPNPWALWTWGIVNNKIYFYQQGLGVIIRIYGSEKGVVVVDDLEPTYIIGSVDQFQWHINGTDNNLNCTDTKKSILIPGLGDFYAYNLDKAHFVKDVIQQWENQLYALVGIGATFIQNSYVQQDVAARIVFALEPPYDPGQDVPTCVETNSTVGDVIPTGGPIEILPGDTPTNLNWEFSPEAPSGACETTTKYYADLYFSAASMGEVKFNTTVSEDCSGGGEIEYETNPVLFSFLSVGVPYSVILTLYYEFTVVIDDPNLDTNTWVEAGLHVTDSKPYRFYDDCITKYTTPDYALGTITYSGKWTKYVSSLYGKVRAYICAPPTYFGDGRENTFKLTNATFTALSKAPEEFRAASSGSYRDTGQTGEWFYDNPPVYPDLNPSYWSYNISAYIGLDASLYWLKVSREFQDTSSKPDASMHYAKIWTQNTKSYDYKLRADVLITENKTLGYTVAILTTTLDYSVGYYLGPTVPAQIDHNTPGAIVLAHRPAGYRYDGTTVDGSGDAVETGVIIDCMETEFVIPAGYYLVIWTAVHRHREHYLNNFGNPAEAIYNFGYNIEVINFIDPRAIDGTGQCIPAVMSAVPRATELEELNITLEHNGASSELVSAWDPITSTLNIGGFKEFGLTTITMYNNGEFLRSVPITSLMDSNDIIDTLRLELQAAFPTLYISAIIDAPAQADIDYNIQISWVDFDGTTPVPALTNDGDCTWLLSSTEVAPLELAQVSGISSARGRLIAWDRLNAIYTSSNQDPLDFVPDIATQANVGMVQSVQGNIVLCLGWNNGFIIYSTGNIVRAEYTGGTYVFNYGAIADSGVIDVRHITGNFDNQFVWSNKGLLAVNTEQGAVEEITPELLDWFSQHPFPLKTSYLNDRYIFFSILARPPGILIPNVRNELEVTDFRAGAGSFPERQNVLAELGTFPFGSNMFPVYQIAVVYDVVLKKWGNAVLPFKTLYSLNPVNARGYPAEKAPDYNESQLFNESRSLGGLLEDGSLVLFNDAADDSYLCFGHAKFQVMDWSRIKEVTAEFINYASSTIQVEPSSDGRTVDWPRVASSESNDKAIQTFYLDLPAEWFNIVIRGTYHLRSLTIKGFPHARI